MTKPYTGGCACSAVRYEIAGEPLAQNHCQCRACQQATGAGHGSILAFGNRQAVKLEGAPAGWDAPAGSGDLKTNGFCSTCGSPVFLTFRDKADIFAIHAASLDEPDRFHPVSVIYTERGHDWDHIDPALARFDGMPVR